MYYKLPVKERIELMKAYRKANPDMSYSDMVKDYNDSYEKFGNGGTKSPAPEINPYIPYGYKGPYPNMGQTFAPERAPGIDANLLNRQLYKESNFNSDSTSPVGAEGIAQIMPITKKEAIQKKVISKYDDIRNNDVAKKVQKYYMNSLYNAPYINKEGVNQNDSVRLAKTLAAYNWGGGNLIKHLNKMKEQGIDIYNSYDWVKHLPKETRDYVNIILFKKDPTFEKNYSKNLPNFKDRH